MFEYILVFSLVIAVPFVIVIIKTEQEKIDKKKWEKHVAEQKANGIPTLDEMWELITDDNNQNENQANSRLK